MTSEQRVIESEQEMEVLGVSWGLVEVILMQTWTKILFLQNVDLVRQPSLTFWVLGSLRLS